MQKPKVIRKNDLEWLLNQVERYRNHLWGSTILEYGDCIDFRLEKIKENIKRKNAWEGQIKEERDKEKNRANQTQKIVKVRLDDLEKVLSNIQSYASDKRLDVYEAMGRLQSVIDNTNRERD